MISESGPSPAIKKSTPVSFSKPSAIGIIKFAPFRFERRCKKRITFFLSPSPSPPRASFLSPRHRAYRSISTQFGNTWTRYRRRPYRSIYDDLRPSVPITSSERLIAKRKKNSSARLLRYSHGIPQFQYKLLPNNGARIPPTNE